MKSANQNCTEAYNSIRLLCQCVCPCSIRKNKASLCNMAPKTMTTNSVVAKRCCKVALN